MKLRIYLDTSTISLVTDDRSPERRDLTRSFFARAPEFVLFTSEAAREEILDTWDSARREVILSTLASVEVLPVTQGMISLAQKLVAAGVFTPRMEADALHVAAAALSDAHLLVSWNFQHLVNRRRRALINWALVAEGLKPIEILSPPEV